ncbi:MAG: hypothetical protein RI945_32 [Candidatus Parcubacteria bacterium]|jgi:hypothetical protein
MAKGIKALHLISEDKKLTSLFSEEQLKIMEKRGITQEAFYNFKRSEVEIEKCSLCKNWQNVRTLFHMYNIETCIPCKFEAGLK